ncbi:tetratricopeptide repeat protein [Streptomyces sp. LX-29]|uniref:tetratricopeptide repeat protein n=1 Tax=Streptomyces sp. LX-29 TaxID=2900152 RepID=UPI00240E3CDE|nr:tetratricopeptide repeat protein [Streptomyces sp. LX-29]WFB10627.1 tetratricopeptide repeat protein [Streptomyces sp. LX-29]
MTLHPAVDQADALIDLKRYEQARRMLAGHLAEDTEDVRAWVKLGRCHLAEGNAEQSLAALDQALRIAPEDVGALHMRAHALRRADHLDKGTRWQQAEASLRVALRVEPQSGAVHALLGELLAYYPHRHAEALHLAREAVRLDPEDVRGYEALWTAAAAANDVETFRWALREVLRIDPANPRALLLVTEQEAHQPGTTATQAAEKYADALAVVPDSPGLRQDLDQATYRLLRGVRWLALVCVAAAGVMVDLFPQDGEAPRELPVPLGNRLWALVPMAALWGFVAWRRYRGLRTGVRLTVWSLARRGRWARVVIAQAGWAMLCSLLISQVPWTERTVPQILFWAGLLPTLATIWFDHKKRA